MAGQPPPGQQFYTAANGCPILNPQASLRIGNQLKGTLLLQDINLLETLSHITHERIPERIVHAKGAGAFGEFEVTHDISDFTSAAFLNTVGKKTKLFARFSTVAGGKGSADSVRDTRGFAFKMYTEEGNLDWVFFSEPVFPIRDGGKFPSFVHALKGDPQTNLKSPTAFWDFMNHNPETYHAIMMIFSDRGTPASYRNSEIFGLNTYKFTKSDGTFFYIKIHMKTNQGVVNFTQDEATKKAGEDPDFLSRDLIQSIKDGNFPSWDVFAQIMTPQDAEHYPVNIFDPTKVWSQKDHPLVPFGKITLNQNATNFFSEVEQVSFSPTAIVPGWDISPDPILQTRLFAYGDAARYRLGINFIQTPVNRPLYSYNPAKRDGASNIDNYGSDPNYFPSDFGPTIIQAKDYEQAEHEQWVGTVTDFVSTITDDDFVQPRDFWAVLGTQPDQQQHLISNVASNLKDAVQKVRNEAYAIFTKIDASLGSQIQMATEKLVPPPSPNRTVPVPAEAS